MYLLPIAAATLSLTFLVGCTAHFPRPAGGVNDTAVPASSNAGRHTQWQPIPQFDAAHAYRLIEQQVALGPRAPGSPGHDSCRLFIREYLQRYADTVFEQTFTHVVYGRQLRLTNVGASFRSDLPHRVLLCAHWDTRPYADEDPEPTNRTKPILGANDGASGVAVLLELARIFAHYPPPVGVDILLVDGEDMGHASDLDNFCLGSRYAARNYPFAAHPLWVVVVDLVGDREAWFPWEEYSWQSAPELLRRLWSIGKEYYSGFREEFVAPIFDDHVSFIQRGFRSVLIIDAELVGNRSPTPRRRYWHTLRDTPENISQATLRAVGQTLATWIYGSSW